MNIQASWALSLDKLQSTGFGKRLLTKQSLGIFIVLFSAINFGAITPFARLAYENGVNVVTVMMARYAVASIAVILFLASQGQRWKLTGNILWKTVALAFFLGIASYSYIGSIIYIPVSLSVLIFYTYPILVSLLVYFARKRRSLKEDRLAHYLTFGGQLLSLVGLLFLLRMSWNALNLTGVFMAAFSSISFALVFAFGSRLLQIIPPMVLNLYIAVVNTIFFASVGMLNTGISIPLTNQGWMGLIGVAVFFTIGFLGLFVGVRMIGASRAACLTNIEPVVTIPLAIVLLGEPFSAWQFLGAGAVVLGIFIMCRNIIFGKEISSSY